MDIAAYRDEIRLRLTGNILELELDDNTLDSIINMALREIQRYYCSTKMVTIPYSKCIDLSEVKDEFDLPIKVSSISRVFRATGFTSTEDGVKYTDPMYASQWQLLSGIGSINGISDYTLNYTSWNTLLQIQNTTSTDMIFNYDKSSNRLYINISSSNPGRVTIEYVPRLDTVDEIVSDFWIDSLMRLCVALTKVTVGRIRSKFTQSNALWSNDGAQILEEGNQELNTLREYLQTNTQLIYGID